MSWLLSLVSLWTPAGNPVICMVYFDVWNWKHVSCSSFILCLKKKEFWNEGRCNIGEAVISAQPSDCVFGVNLVTIGLANDIFLNQNVRNSINISRNFLPKDEIHNITSLVQIMAWRRPGDKSLSEPLMVRLPMHICVTRPQCVNKKSLIKLIHTRVHFSTARFFQTASML